MAAVVIVSPFAGERFVGLVAQDIAEVGDRGVEIRHPRCNEGTEHAPSDGGCCSWRPSRFNSDARTASGLRIDVVLPESW